MANKKALRKLCAKEARHLKPRTKKKAFTPEAAKTQFSHIIKNPQDFDAVERYKNQMEKALKTSISGQLQQFLIVLKAQVTDVHAFAFPEMEGAYTETLKGLFFKLNNLKKEAIC